MFFVRIALLMLLVSPSATLAEELEPVSSRLNYEFTWGGMPIALVGLQFNEDESHYSAVSDIKTTGLVRVFDRHESRAQVRGMLTDDHYQPSHYVSQYTTNGEPHRVELTYDPKGRVVEDFQEPTRERDDPRPPVATGQKTGSVEPLTMLLKIRRMLHESRESGESYFSFPMYDGKRLAMLHFEISPSEPVRLHGKSMKAIHVTASRQPIAGFKAKELKKIAKGEPKLHVYFSDTPQLLPVLIKMDLSLGTLTGTLSKPCVTPQDCIIPAKAP